MAHARVIPLHGNTTTPINGAPETPARQAARRGRTQQSPPEPPAPQAQEPEPAGPRELADRLADFVAFTRRRLTGEYDVDEFGFDAELADNMLLPPLRQLFQKWFRVEVIGAHNLPEDTGALLVANHSGTFPVDAMMTAVAVRDHHPQGRFLRMLGADLVFRTPVVGSLARKSGQTLACNADAERLLRDGHLVGVWPEGFKGIGKPFRDRYKLQRFGRGGFVSAALRTGTPIVPCAIVGAEEIYPKIADLKPLARLFGFPYFPVTPLFPHLGPLGLVPLPSKWFIEFGEPIRTDEFGAGAEEDPMLMFNLTDQVRETIQQTLYRLLSQRNNVFLG
ncbi:MAG TPA: lysophospholipid acyltransferase family protein [Pseudonocardiaceae bacterium]|nr:lysophospholipid acyltransferase family protein [Pseudonocardiaceae bacterium]